jgi:periplasmic divalent cation tolerance protein
MTDVLVAFSTFPDRETARRIARELVEHQIVACANLRDDVESIYRWQGKIETASETLVIFKLAAASYDAFEAKLRQLHPYDVPEIVALAITRGLQPYLEWVRENCATRG